jgi:GTP-binding protein
LKFVDEVTIKAVAGSGGDGHIGWHREKYVPMGGPDGGDGGDGGAVIFLADSSINTLIDFAYTPTLRGQNGATGSSNNKKGSSGKEIVRRVPVGTQCFYDDELVADLNVSGARWVVARGGRGGRGNTTFKSAENRAPHIAERGQEGESVELKLSLKLVADVGLVGLPNAGKSTLISKISAAKPRIADYPFTTLTPNLGVVRVSDEKSFVVADIPGLIPGAHEGKGLGHEFLKHLERTASLLFLIDVSHLAYVSPEPDDEAMSEAVIQQYNTLDKELSEFSDTLRKLPRIAAISKSDLDVSKNAYDACGEWFKKQGLELYVFSSHREEGLSELKSRLYENVAHCSPKNSDQ